jgi:O-antigen ligase
MKRNPTPVYVLFASSFVGVFLQQVYFLSMVLVNGFRALMKRDWPQWRPWFRVHGAILIFAVVMLMSAVYQQFVVPGAFDYHWAFFGIWVLGSGQIRALDWNWVHRAFMIGSLPGLIYSFYWLLRPDEIAWALQVGFHMYPRAAGLLSNPITHAECLALVLCWSLARLHNGVGTTERRLIYAYIGVAFLIILASRVRAGVLVFSFLFLLHALISPRHRKIALIFIPVLILGGVWVVSVFGFNMESIHERFAFWQHAWNIMIESPWLGIGPDRWELYPFPGKPDIPAHPHNTFLGILTEFGVLGLLAFLGVMFVLGKRLFNLYRNPGEGTPTWVVMALSYGFLSFFLFGLFDYNFHDTELLIIHSIHWCVITRLPLGPPKEGRET